MYIIRQMDCTAMNILLVKLQLKNKRRLASNPGRSSVELFEEPRIDCLQLEYVTVLLNV